MNEKHGNFYAPTPQSAVPPPAYASSPAASALVTASALYEYHPSDAGDLAILPNDRIFITEFMNADWAKGRNDRTSMEGIFPRSYVAIMDEKAVMGRYQPPPLPMQSSYGNMPVDVSQSGSSSVPGKESKLNANGKKFGKKMGNAGECHSWKEMAIRGYPVLLILLSYFWCWCYDRIEHCQWDFLNAGGKRWGCMFYGAEMEVGKVSTYLREQSIDHAL